ncbi:MAG: prepilin-type N-terminal cleavage/methylation domain-containing protein [Candidatus Omnitrophica bacterium]|nr:prepilin-type N-terminal cleavage/methylation domain-containing protein [Candidatus Omnitrophota bacterium]
MLVYYPTWRAIHFNHPFAHSFRSKRRRIKVLVSFRKPSDRLGRGFTLIELLIVIAIILILIAIALPNFLEAQERARVARAAGHLRTMETAVFSFITQYGYLYADYNDPAGVKRETRNHQPLATGPCPIFSPGVLGDGGLSFGSDPNGNDTNFQGTFYAPSVHCPLTTPIQFIDGTSTVDPWSDGSVPVGMDSRLLWGVRTWNELRRGGRQDCLLRLFRLGTRPPFRRMAAWMRQLPGSRSRLRLQPYQWNQEPRRPVVRGERVHREGQDRVPHPKVLLDWNKANKESRRVVSLRFSPFLREIRPGNRGLLHWCDRWGWGNWRVGGLIE